MTGDGRGGDAEARAALIMHLRRQNVAGREVLAALEMVPRALFLSAADKRLAYTDRAAPIDCGQTISQPTIVALMTEALALASHHRVLEVGTGSGYQAAVLAHLCAEVYSVERFRLLSELAAERLRMLGLRNVHLSVGDGHAGWPDKAPFDRIMVTAAAAEVPDALTAQLAPGGMLIAPVGEADTVQTLTTVRREEDRLITDVLTSVRFVPMVRGTAQKL